MGNAPNIKELTTVPKVLCSQHHSYEATMERIKGYTAATDGYSFQQKYMPTHPTYHYFGGGGANERLKKKSWQDISDFREFTGVRTGPGSLPDIGKKSKRASRSRSDGA